MDKIRIPEDIECVLDKIGEIWLKYPNLRLGQLLSNSLFIRSSSAKTNVNAADLFYLEDEELIEKIQTFDRDVTENRR